MTGTNWLHCEGGTSCSDSTTNANHTNCDGTGACSNTTLKINNQLWCNGDKSCASSTILPNPSTTITTTTTIQGSGAYSLNDAKISTTGDGDSVMVEFLGFFAGYGATIDCLDGDSCTVKCYGTACINVNLTCFDGSNCTVICDNSESHACPNVYYDETKTPTTTLSTTTFAVPTVEPTVPTPNPTTGDGPPEDVVPTYTPTPPISQPSYTPTPGTTTTPAPLFEGRLFNSNEENTLDRYYDYEVLFDVLDVFSRINDECDDADGVIAEINKCDNATQCELRDFDTNDPICCRGFASCSNTTINGNISTNGEFVLCSGKESCVSDIDDGGATISALNSIYCIGNEACYGNTLITNSTIFCDSEDGCFGTTIKNARKLFCMSEFACSNAIVFDVNNIYIAGGNRYLGSTLTIFGGKSLKDMNMSVFFLATGTGYNVNVYCENDAFCHVECGVGGACSSTSTNVFCLDESLCTVYCNDTIGIDCPNTTGNVEFVSQTRLQSKTLITTTADVSPSVESTGTS